MTATVEFAMPSLGADMDSGTVLEWRIGPGDEVERGDIVAIVETDKADIDIEVWHRGVVSEILVHPGVEVPVGTPLALLEVSDSGQAPAAPPPDVAAPPAPAAEGRGPAPEVDERIGVGVGGDGGSHAPAPDVRSSQRPDRATDPAPIPTSIPASISSSTPASPLARRLAAERNVDLTSVAGSGPGGAVVARDVETAAESTDHQRDPAARMRAAIAELMARSKRDIPHYYLATDIDLGAAIGWLETVNAERSVEDRILPSALLLKAVALASARNEEFNGFWIDGRFQPGDGVHLGVAVSLRGGGLVAPAIHDADGLSLTELMVALRDLVGRARSGRLRGSEMTDSTLTVSNLGDRGVALVAGVIYPPQVALVGLGRILTRPAVVDGEVVVRPQVTATLAADHRATDGQLGARYLNTIDRLLQKPDQL